MTFDPEHPDKKISVALFRYHLIADAVEADKTTRKPLLLPVAPSHQPVTS